MIRKREPGKEGSTQERKRKVRGKRDEGRTKNKEENRGMRKREVRMEKRW